MHLALAIPIDLLAVALLALGVYFPRYRRKDVVVAIVSLNVGVMAVAIALTSTEVTAGLGLGLFGVLSIIRLRSSELNQEEVAYYFSALAIGVLGGVDVDPAWLAPTMMAAIVAALYVGDHPRIFSTIRRLELVLDGAFTSEADLIAHLEELLDGEVQTVVVSRVDLVNDTTSVDVRFTIASEPAEPRAVRRKLTTARDAA